MDSIRSRREKDRRPPCSFPRSSRESGNTWHFLTPASTRRSWNLPSIPWKRKSSSAPRRRRARGIPSASLTAMGRTGPHSGFERVSPCPRRPRGKRSSCGPPRTPTPWSTSTGIPSPRSTRCTRSSGSPPRGRPAGAIRWTSSPMPATPMRGCTLCRRPWSSSRSAAASRSSRTFSRLASFSSRTSPSTPCTTTHSPCSSSPASWTMTRCGRTGSSGICTARSWECA